MTAPTPTPTEPAPNPGGNTNDLPQWARDAISKGNNEAATFRTQLREKTNELTAALDNFATLAGEKDSAVERATVAETALLKLNVALNAGIPGDKAAVFAARLQGTTEDELKADADALKGAFGTEVIPSATDPSQGRGADPTPNTPEAAMAGFLREQFESILKK